MEVDANGQEDQEVEHEYYFGDDEENETLLIRDPPEVVVKQSKEEQPIDFETLSESTLPPIDSEVQLRNIMDCILPPRTYESEGKIWRERTSTVPATRHDILETQEKFEKELKKRNAKPFGICQARRDVYDQLFDELIRQVTVNCAERGLMLLRVRDEFRLTICSYQRVLESSIAYGLRKAIAYEQQQSKAILERKKEYEDNRALTSKVEELQRELQNMRHVSEEELELLEERMKDENERLKEANKMLKNQLTTLLQMDQDFREEHQPAIQPNSVRTFTDSK